MYSFSVIKKSLTNFHLFIRFLITLQNKTLKQIGKNIGKGSAFLLVPPMSNIRKLPWAIGSMATLNTMGVYPMEKVDEFLTTVQKSSRNQIKTLVSKGATGAIGLKIFTSKSINPKQILNDIAEHVIRLFVSACASIAVTSTTQTVRNTKNLLTYRSLNKSRKTLTLQEKQEIKNQITQIQTALQSPANARGVQLLANTAASLNRPATVPTRLRTATTRNRPRPRTT
jgi:hypothetical protein